MKDDAIFCDSEMREARKPSPKKDDAILRNSSFRESSASKIARRIQESEEDRASRART